MSFFRIGSNTGAKETVTKIYRYTNRIYPGDMPPGELFPLGIFGSFDIILTIDSASESLFIL